MEKPGINPVIAFSINVRIDYKSVCSRIFNIGRKSIRSATFLDNIMLKTFFLILLFLGSAISGLTQTTAASLRAQGRYYSAKEAFEKGQFDEAARMLRESREMLGGKTNVRLQYLLVRSLYNGKRYQAAQTEMNTYLEIEVDKKDRYASFPQDVDRLTSDETREITILIDKIDTEVAKGTENANQANEDRATVVAVLRNSMLSSYIARGAEPGKNTEVAVNIEVTGDYQNLIFTTEFAGKTYSSASESWKRNSDYTKKNLVLNLTQLSSFSIKTAQPNDVPTLKKGGRVKEGGYVSYSIVPGMVGEETAFIVLGFNQLIEIKEVMPEWDEQKRA
jgi:hypothetical protein